MGVSDYALEPHGTQPSALAGALARGRRHAGRIALIAGAAVVLLLVLTQLFLPGIGEGAIEDRLTENGGVADVSLSATPAARLLWGDGDRLAIDGTGLGLDLDATDPVVFDDLDRFGEVEIVLHDSAAGPFEVDSFILTRDGDEPYTLVSDSSASVSDMARFGIERAQLPGAGVVGAILGIAGVGSVSVPVEMDMKLASDAGRIRVIEGGGTVAGFPTGPLAELITTAIVVQL